MRKVTQSYIRNEIADGAAIDVSGFPYDKLCALARNCDTVAVSSGVYGVNGCIVQSRVTGALYAVPKRSSALLVLV